MYQSLDATVNKDSHIYIHWKRLFLESEYNINKEFFVSTLRKTSVEHSDYMDERFKRVKTRQFSG